MFREAAPGGRRPARTREPKDSRLDDETGLRYSRGIPRERPIDASRRLLLLSGVAAALGSLSSTPLRAATVRASTERRLSFENLHTGERLDCLYWTKQEYSSQGLHDVAWILRDHRTDGLCSIDPQLLDLLHALRTTLRTSSPYQVISGYRSPATNLMLASTSSGVARESLHTRGMAIDIRIPGIALARLRDAAMSLRGGGVGYYPRSNFVHIDVGRVRYW